MSVTQFIGISVLSALLVLGLILGASKLVLAHPGQGVQIAGWSHFGHGRAKAMAHHGLARFCAPERGERINDLARFVESFIKLTPDQTTAWNRLLDSLRAGSTSIDSACEEFARADKPDTATERLARVESLLSAGLDAVRQVRPAFDGFYAALDEDQKRIIDELISKRRSHRR